MAGVILDSSVIIAAERRSHTVRQNLEQVRASQGEIEIGVSVVTIAVGSPRPISINKIVIRLIVMVGGRTFLLVVVDTFACQAQESLKNSIRISALQEAENEHGRKRTLDTSGSPS